MRVYQATYTVVDPDMPDHNTSIWRTKGSICTSKRRAVLDAVQHCLYDFKMTSLCHAQLCRECCENLVLGKAYHPTTCPNFGRERDDRDIVYAHIEKLVETSPVLLLAPELFLEHLFNHIRRKNHRFKIELMDV